ncbi:S-layer homology domain-containing protein [Cohnella nanjingensis]|uniref:S-layer homology domain-containing protein n=1 Tax=Cohnella nanjingensis TaxID=1387779 RepID=A0A7X0VIP7_9BACL|nr:S-layer homology domain-containing protein [Cohnella nanjingensis]MBB6675161.1 S-layer homology domain-containing protein [Cohnella nanjingensis]
MRQWTLIATCVALLWAGSGGAEAWAAGTGTAATAASTGSAFKDTKGHWAEKTIARSVANGILDGYPDGTFRPNEPVKVDQFIKMLILSETDKHPNGERSWNPKFLQSLTADNQNILKQDYRYFDFKANAVGYWAKPYIDVASDLNFLNKSRYADFQSSMTRQNVAEVLYYTIKETEFLEDDQFSLRLAAAYGDLMSGSDRERRFIAETLAKGIMEGYPNGYFGVGQTVTRAEALVLLERLTDKTKRLAVQASAKSLEREVPTGSGGRKVVVFPNRRMYDAYDVLVQAGALRGSNQDLFETTLRLFKDQEEKDGVLNKQAAAGSAAATEEAALWLDPVYDTYGITMRLRSGTLSRNAESVKTFGNYLFGYNAATFNTAFMDVCNQVALGKQTESKQLAIGDDTVSIQVDMTAKTVIFSIAKKK